MLNPTYKSRHVDFKRLFKDIPSSERLIVGEFIFCSLSMTLKLQQYEDDITTLVYFEALSSKLLKWLCVRLSTQRV